MQNVVDFTQEHEYQHKTGDVVVPRAVGSPVVINLHQAYSMRVTSWSSASVNQPPRVPLQEAPDSASAYIGGRVNAPLPVPNNAADGYVWNVSGEYVFVLASPLVLDGVTPMPTGEYPLEVPAIKAFADELGAQGFDSESAAPWPKTYLPAVCAVAGLINRSDTV